MFQKTLVFTSLIVIFGNAIGMQEIAVGNEGKGCPLYVQEAKKVIESFDINNVSVDSKQMCDLENKIACGSHISGKLDMESFKFRKELARLALEKIDFNETDATEKAALICFALQSTSCFSAELWNEYKIGEKLFSKGRSGAESKLMEMYRLTKDHRFDFISWHIWGYMYSNRLIANRIPE